MREQTGLELGYVEQLYTFADRNRDPSERAGGPRMVSIAYLALVREGRVSGAGQRALAGRLRVPALGGRPVGPAAARREGDRARAGALGGGGRRGEAAARRGASGPTSPSACAARPSTRVRVLERYELLYEAGLVDESARDAAAVPARLGRWIPSVSARRWPSTTAG